MSKTSNVVDEEYKDLLGNEYEYTVVNEKTGKSYTVKAFVAGICRSVGITIKPVDMEEMIEKHFKTFKWPSIDNLRQALLPPYDYVYCIVPNGFYERSYGKTYTEMFDQAIKILRSKKSIKSTDLVRKVNCHFSSGIAIACGFSG